MTFVVSHTTLQYIISVGVIAQQLGNLATQIDESLANLKIVLRIVVRTDGVTRHVHLLSQFPLGRIRHEGRIRRHIQCESPTL